MVLPLTWDSRQSSCSAIFTFIIYMFNYLYLIYAVFDTCDKNIVSNLVWYKIRRLNDFSLLRFVSLNMILNNMPMFQEKNQQRNIKLKMCFQIILNVCSVELNSIFQLRFFSSSRSIFETETTKNKGNKLKYLEYH